MVLPHLTENYGFSRDPPEKEAPQCAVHNFPHNIDQCLVLAQSEFVGNFDTIPRETADFMLKGASWVDELRKVGSLPCTALHRPAPPSPHNPPCNCPCNCPARRP